MRGLSLDPCDLGWPPGVKAGVVRPPTRHSSCSRPLIRTSAISLYDIVLLLYYIGSTGLCSNHSDRNQCFCVLNCLPTVLTVNCQVDSVCSLNHPFHPFVGAVQVFVFWPGSCDISFHWKLFANVLWKICFVCLCFRCDIIQLFWCWKWVKSYCCLWAIVVTRNSDVIHF